MTTNLPLLELKGVCKSFGSPGEESRIEVLKGIDLAVKEGESVALVGPSGSGKSTLLHMMGMLDRPDSGQVVFGGRDLSGMAEPEAARFRNRQIGFVFQMHHLLPQCSVLENVLLPSLAAPQEQTSAEMAGRAEQLIEKVGLAQRRNHRPGELSVGERQRAAVARALINKPRLLLADEPTGSLDHATAQNLADLLEGLRSGEQLSLVVVTHSMELARHMDRILRLVDGKLESIPAELIA